MKSIFFWDMTTAVKTSNPTQCSVCCGDAKAAYYEWTTIKVDQLDVIW
jgi:hypothetical protein